MLMLSQIRAWSQRLSRMKMTWAIVAISGFLSIPSFVSVSSLVVSNARVAQLNHHELERRVNGPFYDYVYQLTAILPADSCILFFQPSVFVDDRARQAYTVPLTGVLINTLYPRDIRLVRSVDEALMGASCAPGTTYRYILCWVEPVYVDDMKRLAPELMRLETLPIATETSRYVDHQGNTGRLFLLY